MSKTTNPPPDTPRNISAVVREEETVEDMSWRSIFLSIISVFLQLFVLIIYSFKILFLTCSIILIEFLVLFYVEKIHKNKFERRSIESTVVINCWFLYGSLPWYQNNPILERDVIIWITEGITCLFTLLFLIYKKDFITYFHLILICLIPTVATSNLDIVQVILYSLFFNSIWFSIICTKLLFFKDENSVSFNYLFNLSIPILRLTPYPMYAYTCITLSMVYYECWIRYCQTRKFIPATTPQIPPRAPPMKSQEGGEERKKKEKDKEGDTVVVNIKKEEEKKEPTPPPSPESSSSSSSSEEQSPSPPKKKKTVSFNTFSSFPRRQKQLSKKTTLQASSKAVVGGGETVTSIDANDLKKFLIDKMNNKN